MKKILFSLVALVCSMSMNAQVMKVMKGNTVVATYTADQADKVVFEEAQGSTTTGTAVATGIGNVGWVQLWAGGPKFAEKNVGASSYTDGGITMTFTQATADPFEWGSNWRTPSQGEMDELLKAATSAGSEKVTCTYTEKNGVYGFEFTGSTAGYESNSVFFPAQYGDSDTGDAYYWSGTASGDEGWIMNLTYYSGFWDSGWYELSQDNGFLVRPVLKN